MKEWIWGEVNRMIRGRVQLRWIRKNTVKRSVKKKRKHMKIDKVWRYKDSMVKYKNVDKMKIKVLIKKNFRIMI